MGKQLVLCQLENLIRIQRACVSKDSDTHDYMHGMLNGLICAHSVLSGYDPAYHSSKKKRKSNIRHKRKYK